VSWRLQWTAAEVLPAGEQLARAMGMPDGRPLSPAIARLVEQARDTFLRLAEPRAVAAEVSLAAFARIHQGAGHNDARLPLAGIHPRAEALALFVATLGAPLCDAIAALFARQEPAMGYVLDTTASEAADSLALRVAAVVEARARAQGRLSATARALPYSPGYCGWHVSGQAALFEALGPEAPAGVTLNDSCLMQPLKSVSGVVIVAPPDVHRIETDFDCCAACATRHCEARHASLVGE
jgi:hypothetical protein